VSERSARVLVTGASGFVGGHAIAELESRGLEVAGLSRTRGRYAVDLADSAAVRSTLAEFRPTHVLHLAGAIPSAPGGIPVLYRSNVQAMGVLLRAAADVVPDGRVMVLSSSAVYGRTPTPIAEEGLSPAPISAYGLSKAAGEDIALRSRSLGQDVSVVRGFNLSGPGLPPGLVLSDVAAQVALGGTVRVGNLESRRDWMDVRDAARALADLLLGAASFDVVNLGTGRSVLVRECVERIVHLGGGAQIENDETRRQVTDIPDQVASLDRFQAILPGWRSKYALETSLEDVLADWRGRIKSSPRP
jgi:nucleoside-diphosphate-sugar epimerase